MKKVALADVYSETLYALAGQDSRIVALDADVAKRMGTLYGFADTYKQRHINVGIAEQNMIGVAAGLASVGKIPFAGTFAMFVTGRAWEQVRQSVAYPCLNVKLVGAHGGLSVGEDGATHQACEDICLMRTLPNMTVLAPCDPQETRQAVVLAANTPGPFYIRLFRPPVGDVTPTDYTMAIGKAVMLRPGGDVTIAAHGLMTHVALEAAAALANDGIKARVLNVSTIKPLDREAIISAIRETAGIVTVEDHTIIGGLGSAVAEVFAEEGGGRLARLGVPDRFGASGDPATLFAEYGLSIPDIVAAAHKILAANNR